MSEILDYDLFKVRPGKKVKLDRWDPGNTSGYNRKKNDATRENKKLRDKLDQLQEKLYAVRRYGLLIVLQAMDTGGKDSTIRLVFRGVNPQGVRVANFKQPTPEERAHDFLWRIHKQVPLKGEIVIFNRSHYEAVLIERVHKLAPEDVENKRYEEINEFERTLHEEGTTVVKFFLHISSDEQRKRLNERLDDPTKEWKFSASDLAERKLWPEYMGAYERALEKTSTEWAPWYIVPSDHKWFRDLIVATVIVRTLEKMNLRYPRLEGNKKKMVIP